MLTEDRFAFEVFKQASLCNSDTVSSLVDLSQPVADICAFVPYVYDAVSEANF